MSTVPISQKILGWTVTVITPLVILMLAVRIMITPAFAKVEYRMPGFPEDEIGFTLQDRLLWSEPSIKYLINREGIDFLEDLTFDDDKPLFNASELSHMVDVKRVVTGMRIALMVASLWILAVVVIAVRNGWREHLLLAFGRGGWALVGLIAAILLLVLLNFNQLFTVFHQLFFASGTWQFYTSDTLIRLFPMRFWQDAFIFVGVLSLLMGVGVIVLTGKYKNSSSATGH